MYYQKIPRNDALKILTLIQGGMDENHLDMSIYRSPKCKNYLNYMLDSGLHETGYYYYGYYTGDKLAGFSEWRDIGNTFFLNNIYVDSSIRGNGIGKHLINHGIDIARNRLKKDYISLDTFHHTAAHAWYKSLGFRTDYTFHWLVEDEISPPSSVHEEQYKIMNYSQYKLCLDKFGFSTLTLMSHQKHVEIGVLGDKYYRIPDPALLSDNKLMNTLANLKICSKFLVLAPADAVISYKNLKVMAVSDRMTLPLTNDLPERR